MLNIGIDRCNPEDVRRVRTMNLTLIGAIVFTMVYTIGYAWIKAIEPFLFNVFILIIESSLLFFIHKGFNRFASIMLPIVVIIHVGVLSVGILLKASGVHYYLFAVSSLSFLIIHEKDKFWLIVIAFLGIFIFSIIEYGSFQSPFSLSLSDNILSILHASSTIGTGTFITGIIFVFYLETKRAQRNLQKERDRSEELLLNILPAEIAERLKSDKTTIADNFSETTVMFADIVNFSQLASKKPPQEVVELLNTYFRAFDDLVVKHEIEKIKTIGDAYMAASGLPSERDDHAEAMLNLAIDIMKSTREINQKTGLAVQIRIGINSGPVTAGVIGHRKFTYDIWGDTVNIASRMESNGIANKIQVSESTYERLKNKFNFEFRGKLEVKGKGIMPLYLLDPALA